MFFCFIIGLCLTNSFEVGNPGQWRHEYYVSRTVVNWNTQEMAAEVSLHIFADDLELAILKNAKREAVEEIGKNNFESQVTSYLKKNFLFYKDNEYVEWSLVGIETTDDLQALWCFLEFPVSAGIEKFTLTNKILVEVYETQKNIVELRVDGESRDVFMLTRGKETIVLQP